MSDSDGKSTNGHDPLTVLRGGDLPVTPIPRSRRACARGWKHALCPFRIEPKELS